MATLARDLRRELERTVRQARRVAETGARKVLEQLAVHHHEPWSSMTPEARALRNRLRAHSRQLGDHRDPKRGTQSIGRLVQECAYEHWHRMLFARFLAETDLLIEPKSGVAITLDEAQELAREKGADWLEIASEYAERMLPQIFRKDDPVLAVSLPTETRSELEDLLKALPREVFLADDSLGWVYQFWQADKKEEVNRSEKKIGADELPAVTQLFTEDYMVLYLLHNTLGAWWAGKVLAANPNLTSSAKSEDELRTACKVGDVEWTYLRFVRDKTGDGGEGPWRPAAGMFDGWPKTAKDITVLDPCMGSGHFLVFALPILVAFRTAEEGLSREAAVEAVLRDNLFGLEIDQRCTQIAAFNLAFAAWRMVGYRPLPRLNLACSGLAIGVTKAEWLRLAAKVVTAADPAAKRDLLGVEKNLLMVGLEERVKNGLEALYDLFAKAPWLGSLIDPRRAGADIFRQGFDKLEPLLASILAAANTDDAREMAVAAQGMAKAAELLGREYTLVVTNVPFLTQLKFGETINDYVLRNFSEEKPNLATCMARRCIQLCRKDGVAAFVAPQSWWFLKRYQEFRTALVRKSDLLIAARLGENAFWSTQAGGELVGLTFIRAEKAGAENKYVAFDISGSTEHGQKSFALQSVKYNIIAQNVCAKDPQTIIHLVPPDHTSTTLGEFASVLVGATTGDSPRFIGKFWEFTAIPHVWRYFQSTVSETVPFGGMTDVIRWENEKGELFRFAESVRHLNHIAQNWRRGKPNWGKIGVSASMMGDLPASIYTGEIYDSNCCAIVPYDAANAAALWEFCRSGELTSSVRSINQNRKVEVGSILASKFNPTEWSSVADSEAVMALPEPFSDDPEQWLFHGHPGLASALQGLNVAVARHLGYRWPAEIDPGLRLSDEAKERIKLAAAVDSQVPADDDGIVCLTAIKGEPPAEQRLNALLAAAYGLDWSAAKLASVLAEGGYAGKSLEDWLRDGFFAQHCALFHQRPFIWHIWDGRRDGFHVLVNYHGMAAANGEGRRTLEKLIYSYLGDWIDSQRADQKAAVEGADARLAHAEHLKTELVKILEGEPPYDIFVRWKPLHQQPIGWEPDINDGVRMNIRPFMTARPLNTRGANACILRTTPKIKWDMDRGKEPNRDKADYPWFWGWDETTSDFAGGGTFDGNRWNDLRYSRAFKQDARTRHAPKSGHRS